LTWQVYVEEKERPEEDCEQRRKDALSGVQALEVVPVRREEDADSERDRTQELWRKTTNHGVSRCSDLQLREPRLGRIVCLPPP